MRSRSVGPIFSLARQGIELGLEFGGHSLESLVGIAETIEESVYLRGSLLGDASGVRFHLGNPPLRMGSFSSLRLYVDGREVPSASWQVRAGDRSPWRTVSTISRSSPIDLLPGIPLSVAASVTPAPPVGRETAVRLELECPAIPPLVWVEFRDVVGPG